MSEGSRVHSNPIVVYDGRSTLCIWCALSIRIYVRIVDLRGQQASDVFVLHPVT